ncbi:hypothetical protein L2Y96_12380 [Luteibacter aegosomaticola]|uniref:hypothetical protein n=1 Tax=Luteibacter aegosomaticola TaxID=2911538 RepID=UPI001FFAB553|nr:hypothetical protein [Luteibacter aegosomaticola]UPG88216.1 hypothetical protein L2Y96_12380 [Luteibacter aegosomaticola]
MELYEIVDHAHALASAIEDGRIDEAVDLSERIATVARASSRISIADAAERLSAILRLTDKGSDNAWWPALTLLADALREAIDRRNATTDRLAMDPVQRARHARLREVLDEMSGDGITALGAQARALRTSGRWLDAMLNGLRVPDLFAREVEWIRHKRRFWMDEEGSQDGP